MRELVANIAQEPLAWLRRSGLPGEPIGMWAADLASSTVENLRLIVLIDGLSDEPAKLILVDILQVSDDLV